MTTTLPRTATRCSKRPGEYCRLHNPAPTSAVDVFDAVDRQRAKGLAAVRAEIPGALQVKIELDPQVYVGASRPHHSNGVWQGVWIKAADGTPVMYVKVRYGRTEAVGGTLLHEGVYLCDVEVNPAAKGKNVPLGAFRILKQHYGVPHLWTGDTYSESGLRMIRRLLTHEAATGEQIVAFQPHVRPEYLHPTPEDYTFVDDWARMRSEYDL